MQIITIFVAKFYAKIFFKGVIMERFHISIDSKYSELWRYNIIVMSSVSVDDKEVEFLKCRSEVAPIGSSLTSAPLGYNPNRRIEIEHKPATHLTLYIYVLTNTYPHSLDIVDTPPFELRVEVSYGTERRYAHTFEIDQWSGANICLEF